MKWIKASERLPKNPGRYFVKVGRQSIPDNGDKNQVATFTSHKEWYLENHHHSRDFYYICPVEWLDEQGDAIPADLEQRAKIKKLDGLHDLLLGHLEKMTISSQELFDEKKSNPKDKRGALRAAWNKLLMVLFDAKVTVHTIKEITHPNTPKSGELKPAPQASSLEGETTCVFCEIPCEPAPTKRGWSSVRFGKGLHFDCAGKVVDQGNIIAMKELDELGKDPTT